jgi:hypothetical protein
MTEKVNPSEQRPIEAYKTAGAIAFGGHGQGFIVESASPTDLSVQDGGITESNLNAFQETSTSSSLSVDIDGGEAFIFGAWLAIDSSTTVSLSASTSNQTVYVGWNKDGTNDVIIGLDSAFATAAGDTDERLPLWTFDTDGSGVTSVTDERLIGQSVSVSGNVSLEDDAPTLYGDDDDFSIEYDSSSSELELTDEINNTIKQTWDKNGDTHIPSGELNFRNSNSIQDSGTDAIQFDGSANVTIASGSLTLGGDLTATGGETVWDESATEIPDSALGSIDNSTLTNSSLSVAGNSVSLGSSTAVDYIDLSDTGSSFPIPNADLSNSSLSVAGNSVSLGGSTSVSANDLSDVSTSAESAGEVPIWHGTNNQYQNATLSGGNALSVTNGNASITIDVNDDSIQTDQLDLSITPTWTGKHQFNSGLDTRSDIEDGTTVIWDSSAGEIPDSAMGSVANSTLTNDSISISGGTNVNGGSASLGGSISVSLSNDSISISGGTNVNGGSASLGGSISVSLSNDSITLNGGDGLKNGSTASLGGSFSLDVEPNDFAGTFLSDDGSDNLQVDIGSGVSNDGSGNIEVAAGTDLTQDSGGLSHADTSTQGDVSTSGATIIDDLTVDGNGHLTNINTQNRSLDDWANPNNNIDYDGNNLTDLGQLQFRDRSGDSNNWHVYENSTNGHLQFDSSGGGGAMMDLEHNGNLRIEGTINESAAL